MRGRRGSMLLWTLVAVVVVVIVVVVVLFVHGTI
jgi:hypothetical protein